MSRRVVPAVLAIPVVLALVFVSARPAAAADQSVFGYGDAAFHGSTGLVQLNFPVVGGARNRDGSGYWLVSREGRVATFGRAGGHGSAPEAATRSVVGMAATADGGGYWLADAAGGVYAFGNAPFRGSLGGTALAQPVVGMAATPSGQGYWLVARDGGVFAFGDARFFGSTGAIRLAQPMVGMAATPSGRGYWLVARDGGVFAFGDARFLGSTGAIRLTRPVVGMAAHPSGTGYWLVASDGGVFSFGAARYLGGLGGSGVAEPVVGIMAGPSGNGYWLVTTGHLASRTDARPAEVRLAAGTHTVGAGGIPAGEYRVQFAQAGCTWERRRGGSPVAGRTSGAREVVAVEDGEQFVTSGCAPWTSDIYPVRDPVMTQPFGDGTWVVHVDVAFGRWTAPGGSGCVWARLRTFGGDLGSIVMGGTGASPVADIGAFDRGFYASGCGTWTRAT